MQGKLVLVGGGARSGKSRFAMEYARHLGKRRIFVATAEIRDEEMRERIERHRLERGGTFTTLEVPLALARALREAEPAEVVVVDCLTLWLSNLLLRDGNADAMDIIDRHVEELISVLQARPNHVVLVSNEVGLGIVPGSALGRAFRDVAGRTHQRIAAVADEVYLATMGLVLRLLPAPVAVLRPGELPELG